MLSRLQKLSNFSRALSTVGHCFRPEKGTDIAALFNLKHRGNWLARGNGLSYSDCCLLTEGRIIDTRRLNHLLDFDASHGIAVCQSGATIKDLFLFHPEFIPPVLPGTLFTTIGGGIANDVHGKNNHHLGTFGDHIEWIELQIGTKEVMCDRSNNQSLFYATIAGLGLTGVIKRAGIKLRKKSRWIQQQSQPYSNLQTLFNTMASEGLSHEYQVAWLDLLNEPRGILVYGDHIDVSNKNAEPIQKYRWPKLSLALIHPWAMKQFNKMYFQQSKSEPKTMPLWQFNNPLDAIQNWNYWYGKNGLLQFQAVFPIENGHTTFMKLFDIIKSEKASPILAVLKLFTQPAKGLLSFVKPGFTLAIDFVNHPVSKKTIKKMNEFIVSIQGNIYLAKDWQLTQHQFERLYTRHQEFKALLKEINSPMHSNLSRRLGLHDDE